IGGMVGRELAKPTDIFYLLHPMNPKRAFRAFPRMLGGRQLVALAALSALFACSVPQPRQANPTRPLDEQRAIRVIIRAFHDQNDAPVPGRQVELPAGKPLEVDVGSHGHRYGVAYVTAQERLELGQALPARDPSQGDALQLVRGIGPDAEARILVLYDEDYLYDDHVGAEHEEATITAERKLARDVQDFLVKAQSERWP